MTEANRPNLLAVSAFLVAAIIGLTVYSVAKGTPQQHSETSTEHATQSGMAVAPSQPDYLSKIVDRAVQANDGPTVEKLLELARQVPDEQTRKSRNRAATFEWSLVSGQITFVMVCLIVLCGLGLSAYQLGVFDRKKMHGTVGTAHGKEGLKIEGVLSIPRTEIEVSPEKLKLSTDIVGLGILAISLAFFYLYLRFVYPVVLIPG